MRRLLRALGVLLSVESETPRIPTRGVQPAVTPNKFLEDTLLHAKEGYRNTQDVIKFVDTKTAVVTGLSTLAAGALVTVVKWVIEADGESRANMTQIAESHPCLAPWFYAFVSLSLASALFCVGAAVWSVIARSRPKHLENRFTVLFPIYRYRDRHAACRTIEEKLRGMTPADMLSEYEDQLRIVGMIAGKKLKHIRFACFGLLTQLLCFVIAGVLLTMMYVSTEPRLHARAVLAANLVSPPSKTITCYPK